MFWVSLFQLKITMTRGYLAWEGDTQVKTLWEEDTCSEKGIDRAGVHVHCRARQQHCAGVVPGHILYQHQTNVASVCIYVPTCHSYRCEK